MLDHRLQDLPLFHHSIDFACSRTHGLGASFGDMFFIQITAVARDTVTDMGQAQMPALADPGIGETPAK